MPEIAEARALLAALAEIDDVKTATELTTTKAETSNRLWDLRWRWSKGFWRPSKSKAAFGRAREFAAGRRRSPAERVATLFGALGRQGMTSGEMTSGQGGRREFLKRNGKGASADGSCHRGTEGSSRMTAWLQGGLCEFARSKSGSGAIEPTRAGVRGARTRALVQRRTGRQDLRAAAYLALRGLAVWATNSSAPSGLDRRRARRAARTRRATPSHRSRTRCIVAERIFEVAPRRRVAAGRDQPAGGLALGAPTCSGIMQHVAIGQIYCRLGAAAASESGRDAGARRSAAGAAQRALRAPGVRAAGQSGLRCVLSPAASPSWRPSCAALKVALARIERGAGARATRRESAGRTRHLHRHARRRPA